MFKQIHEDSAFFRINKSLPTLRKRQYISKSRKYKSVILLFYVGMLLHKYDLLIWFTPPIKDGTT